MKTSWPPSESDPEGFDLDSHVSLDPSSSCASHARLTRTKAGGKRSVSDPAISLGSGSYKLRSPILSAMKSRDTKTNIEPGKNLLVDLNAIDLT
jgi:hypothetical protein